MLYPNRTQWFVIWVAAVLIFTGCDPRFFTALGAFGENGRWLWPAISGYSVHNRSTVAIAACALLLLWEFSRTPALRMPLLIPAVFVAICVVWVVVGRIHYDQVPLPPAGFTRIP